MIRLTFILAFACSLGHFAHRVFTPDVDRQYELQANGWALTDSIPASHLYLRHTFFASRRPERGWLQILSPDGFHLYVNGKLVASDEQPGFIAAAVVDLTPHLRAGRNAIAVVSYSEHVGQRGWGMHRSTDPRLVAVDGQYRVGPRRHRIDAHQTWRCATRVDRGAHWWFESDFDDSRWKAAEVSFSRLRTSIPYPPGVFRQPDRGLWISPASQVTGQSVLRRTFKLDKDPESAWLRLCAVGSHHVAINGYVIDSQEDDLGLHEIENKNKSAVPVCRAYDLSPYVRHGSNDIAIAFTDHDRLPRMVADVEVRTRNSAQHFGSNEHWQSSAGIPKHWTDRAGASNAHLPCRVDTYPLRVPQWQIERHVMLIDPPRAFLLKRRIQLGLWIGGLACAAGIGSYVLQTCLTARRAGCRPSSLCGTWALLPSALLANLAWLSTFDPRIDAESVFNAYWLLGLLAVPVIIWLTSVTWLSSRRVESDANFLTSSLAHRTAIVVGLASAIVLSGAWLRYAEIESKPLQHDEASALRSTRGFFERGFPSRQIHPDMPSKLVETSELVYLFAVITSCVSDDDRFVVRFPSVVFGSLTIGLIFLAGRRMAGTGAALIGAALYAFSPIAIEMASFGRYFTQLQFFSLLTAFLFWETVRRQDRVNHRALTATTISFLAMYFTWQGSALLSVGMMAACLLHRRRTLHNIFSQASVWFAVLLVGGVIVLHISCRSLHLLQFISYGTGISNLALKPMWKLTDFDPLFCVWESSWNRDAMLPMLGLIGALVVAVGGRCAAVTRFLLLTYLTTALVQASLLPVYTWRYSFHLSPFLVLLSAIALSTGLRAFVRSARLITHHRHNAAVRIVAATMSVIVVGFASGMTVQLTELRCFHIHSYSLPDLRFANLAAATHYVRRHAHEDDIVLASNPHVVDHFLGDGATDYWPQSRLYTQALLDDTRSIPLHRIAGTKMLTTLDDWRELFAAHPRVWYVLVPSRHDSQNTTAVSRFLRQHMDVVYQDYRAMVLFRGAAHRPAGLGRRLDQHLQKSDAVYVGRD